MNEVTRMTLKEFAAAVLDDAPTFEMNYMTKDGQKRYWMEMEGLVIWGAKGFDPDGSEIYVYKNEIGYFLSNKPGVVAEGTITITV